MRQRGGRALGLGVGRDARRRRALHAPLVHGELADCWTQELVISWS